MLLKSPVILTLDLISFSVISYFVNFSSVPRLPTLHDSLEGLKGLSIWLYSLLGFITETQQGSNRKKKQAESRGIYLQVSHALPPPPIKGSQRVHPSFGNKNAVTPVWCFCPGKPVWDSEMWGFSGGWSHRHSLSGNYEYFRLSNEKQVFTINHVAYTNDIVQGHNLII